MNPAKDDQVWFLQKGNNRQSWILVLWEIIALCMFISYVHAYIKYTVEYASFGSLF